MLLFCVYMTLHFIICEAFHRPHHIAGLERYKYYSDSVGSSVPVNRFKQIIITKKKFKSGHRYSFEDNIKKLFLKKKFLFLVFCVDRFVRNWLVTKIKKNYETISNYLCCFMWNISHWIRKLFWIRVSWFINSGML